MNFFGAAFIALTVMVIFIGGIYEKKLRKEELETHKIAAYLHFKDGYVKQIFADEFFLGAGKNSDIRIPLASRKVAPVHAHVYREGEYFYIKNVARGKTVIVRYLGKEQVLHYGAKNILRDGSTIVIGKHIMTFKRGVR